MSAVGNVLRQLIAMGYGTGGGQGFGQLADTFDALPAPTPGPAAPAGASAPRGANTPTFSGLLDSMYDASFQQDPPTRDRVADWQNLDVAQGRSNDGTLFYYPTRPASGRSQARAAGGSRSGQLIGEVDPRYGRLRSEVEGDRRFTQEQLRNLRNLTQNRDTTTAGFYNTDNNAGFDWDVADAVGDATIDTPPTPTPQRRRNPSISRNPFPMAQALGNMRDRDEGSGSIF